MSAARIAVPDLISNSYFPAIAAIVLDLLNREGLDVVHELYFPELQEDLPLGDLRAPRAGAVYAGHRAMDKIHVEGLEKTYASKGGRVTALAQVNLTIGQNEFITLVGPSGCGKSTLPKLIGVLVCPSRGLLLHDGVALTSQSRTPLAFAALVLLTEISIVLCYAITFIERIAIPWAAKN